MSGNVILSDQEKLAWVRLIRTSTIGPISFKRLIKKFGSAERALSELPSFSQRAGSQKPIKLCTVEDAQQELKAAEKADAHVIALDESDYPAILAEIPDPPPIIFVRGTPKLFENPAIAIIGARNASGVGRKLARSLAMQLGEAGITIVSGLARGIDGAAHEAALETGTIAVVAGGVDVVYPPEHDDLTANIAKKGVIISERPPGQRPIARDFPRRNRLIAGLCKGVVVVEAAEKSGTLITARFAADQGREVFAVPGSPLDPRSKGANRLLKQGATLIDSADDIMDAIKDASGNFKQQTDLPLFDLNELGAETVLEPASLDTIKSQIQQMLTYTPIHRDELIREFDYSPGEVYDALLDLVLSGDIEEQSGGQFSLSSSTID